MLKRDKNIIELDVLRILSAVLVFLFHLLPAKIDFGYIGVDFFFILSGYLGFQSFKENYKNPSSAIIYIYKRFIRIFPALSLTILVFVGLGIIFLLPFELRELLRATPHSLAGVSNFYYWSEINYFAFHERFTPFLHTWSTSIEMQFFLIIGVLGLLCIYQKIFFYITIVCLLCPPIIIWYLELSEKTGTYYFTFTRIWEFFFGVLLFQVRYLVNITRWTTVLKFLVFCFCSFFLLLFLNFIDLTFLSLNFFILIFLTSPFFLFSNIMNITVSNFFRSKILFLSRLSYCFFLVHLPVIEFSKILFVSDSPNYFFIASILTLINALLIYTVSDRMYFQKKKIYLLTLTVFSILITSILIQYSKSKNYFENLYPLSDRELVNFDIEGYKSFVTRKFEDTLHNNVGEEKVLIIGDSYAKDFFNILYLSKSIKYIPMVHYVPAECSFFSLISDQNSSERDCTEFRNGFMEKLIKAEKVVIANYWNEHALAIAKEVPVESLTVMRDKEVFWIESKNAEMPLLRSLLQIPFEERKLYKVKRTGFNDQAILNAQIKIRSVAKSFLVLKYYREYKNCDRCINLFDNKGNLIFFDGQHLTKAGAIFFSYLAYPLILKRDLNDKLYRHYNHKQSN